MSIDKYKITRLTNRKPIDISKIQTNEKDCGLVMNYHQTIITQIVEAQEKREFECICAEIQKFIEENNIDVCFAINKNELIDCLQEHQIAKLKISDLEAKLAEKEQEILISQLQAPKEQILSILGSQCIQYNPDQDKISFAVEQLEKVKEYIKTNLMSFQKVPIIQEINNQIKQLKEMSDE